MARKLLVKTPKTTNGTTLVYDAEKNVVYKKSYMELSAKGSILELNQKLPEHLKHIIEEVEVDEPNAVSSKKADLKKKLAELKEQNELADLEKQIAAEEAKISGGQEATEDAGKNPATEVIAAINAAETADAVNALIEGESRKTVLNAAQKKLAALNPGNQE